MILSPENYDAVFNEIREDTFLQSIQMFCVNYKKHDQLCIKRWINSKKVNRKLAATILSIINKHAQNETVS